VLHIPEVRLQLPHLEFPGLFMVRHDAAKIFDAVRSPFLEEEAIETGLLPSAAPAAAPTTPAAAPAPMQCVPYTAPACAAPNQCASTDKALEAVLARLDALEKENAQLRQAQASLNTVSVPKTASGAANPGWSASKPATSQVPVARTRPLPTPAKQTEIAPASYQVADHQPSVEKVAPAPVRLPRGTLSTGLSSPPASKGSDRTGAFGDWASKR